MKLNYLLVVTILGIAPLYAMEKPEEPKQKRLGEIPSLRTIAAEQKAKNINTLEDFQKAVASIPTDLHCELVKALVKAGKLTGEQLLTLIDQHCSGNLALKAYVYYKTTNINDNAAVFTLKAALETFEKIAKKNNDELGYQVAWSIAEALEQDRRPLSDALRTKKADAIEFFLSMGVKPVTADLVAAIENNDTNLAVRLINSGVPVENPAGTINQQPLTWALAKANEKIIDLLGKVGASFTKKYKLIPNQPLVMSIADYQRQLIQPWLAMPANQRPLPAGGGTVEALEAQYKKLLEMIDKYEKLEQKKP